MVFFFAYRARAYRLKIAFPKNQWHTSDVTLYDSTGLVLIKERMKYQGMMNHPLLVRFWEIVVEKIVRSGFRKTKHKIGWKLSFSMNGKDYYILIQNAAAGTAVGDYWGKNFFLHDRGSKKRLLSEFIFNPGESSHPSHPLEELRTLVFCSTKERRKIRVSNQPLTRFA